MKMRRALGVAMILGIVASCTKPKDLQFLDVQNIRIVSMGLTESKIGMDVRFFNPNKQRVQLKDANVKVYANSTYLGNTQMDSVIAVPRNDTFAVPLVLKVQTATALSQAMHSFSDTAVDIRVEGSVKMGKAGIFVNYPINYQRRQSISELKLF